MKWSLLALVIITGVLAGAGKHQQAHGEDRVESFLREPRDLNAVTVDTMREAGLLVGMCVDGFAFWMNANGYMAPQPNPEASIATRRCTGTGPIRGNWVDLREPNHARLKE